MRNLSVLTASRSSSPRSASAARNRLPVSSGISVIVVVRDSRKSRQKWQTFFENRKNEDKITAKTQHQVTEPKTHYTVYKNIITCNKRVCEILSLRGIKIHISTITSRSHTGWAKKTGTMFLYANNFFKY